MPARLKNNSATRCVEVPVPPEAKFTFLAGCAFTQSTNSFSVVAGTDLCTPSTSGLEPMFDTGRNSSYGSNGSLVVLGRMIIVVGEMFRIMLPSAGAFSSLRAASRPLPPGVGSTSTVRLSSPCRRVASRRAIASELPPAANGMTMRNARASCASSAGAASAAPSAATRCLLVGMGIPLWVSRCGRRGSAGTRRRALRAWSTTRRRAASHARGTRESTACGAGGPRRAGAAPRS